MSPSLTTLWQTNSQTPPQIITSVNNLQPGQLQDTSPVAMEMLETPVTNVTNLQTPQIIQSQNSFDSSMETSCLGSIQLLSAVQTQTRPTMVLNLYSPNQGHSTPSFGFLPLGDTPSLENCQNTIPFITPSPISMGNIMENIQQAARAKPMKQQSQQVMVPMIKPLNTSESRTTFPVASDAAHDCSPAQIPTEQAAQSRKITSHKVRTKSSPVQKHLQSKT